MRAQHDRGLPLRGNSNHLKVPGHVAQGIGDIRDDLAGEALVSIRVGDAEGDAGGRVRDDGPVAPVPAVGPAMERVDAIGGSGLGILIREDVEGLAIDLEAGVLDAVRVPPGHAAKVRVLAVKGVVGGVVPAADDVALAAGGVVDEQVRDGGAVGHEVGADAVAVDRVLAVGADLGPVAGDGGVAHDAGERLAGDLGLGRGVDEGQAGQGQGGGFPEHCEVIILQLLMILQLLELLYINEGIRLGRGGGGSWGASI